MIMEFDGKTEKEAIDKAIAELGLERDEFDVEIVEAEKKGFFFKKGSVKIKVHLNSGDIYAAPPRKETKYEPESDSEKEIKEYLEGLLEKMGFPGTVSISFREENKIGYSINSEYSGILIGKKGKNLDAVQLIVNVFAGRYPGSPRIIIDTENYRVRREESLVRLAVRSAEQVRRSRRSKLLEPMNPFERRVVHTALNGMEDIATKSDGEGLFKQVRIIYRGRQER